MHTHINMHVQSHMHRCSHTYCLGVQCKHDHLCIRGHVIILRHMSTCMCIYIITCPWTHGHTCARVYMHTYTHIHTIACALACIHTLTHFLCLTGCRLHQVLEQGNQERRGETPGSACDSPGVCVNSLASLMGCLNGCPNPQARGPGCTAEGEWWVDGTIVLAFPSPGKNRLS